MTTPDQEDMDNLAEVVEDLNEGDATMEDIFAALLPVKGAFFAEGDDEED